MIGDGTMSGAMADDAMTDREIGGPRCSRVLSRRFKHVIRLFPGEARAQRGHG